MTHSPPEIMLYSCNPASMSTRALCLQVAPVHGARFSPAFLEAVAAWAAVEQQRQLSPSQRWPTPPPPAGQPTEAASPAEAGASVAVDAANSAGEADAPSVKNPSCSDADASASVGSAASVRDYQVSVAAEGAEPDGAGEAVQPAADDTTGKPVWQDYSSAAWIAEALNGLQVSGDTERAVADVAASEGFVKAPAGESSVEAAASLRGGGARLSTSGDDSDEVTSPLTRLPGQHSAEPLILCHSASSTYTAA